MRKVRTGIPTSVPVGIATSIPVGIAIPVPRGVAIPVPRGIATSIPVGIAAGAAGGLLAQSAVLIVLAATVGLGAPGWVIGIACGVVTNGLLARGLIGDGVATPRPADWITLARATLVGGVAALVANSFGGPATVPTLVVLSGIALLLDAVDGRVARRTGTQSAVGARFDMEVDAFLILILAVYDARSIGDWVLAIGLARYAFVAAGALLPWLRAPVRFRYWCKVVAAIQGIVLAVAAADVLPRWSTTVALTVALILLAESFGRDVHGLWRHRHAVVDAAASTTTAIEGSVSDTPNAGLAARASRPRPGTSGGKPGLRRIRAPITTVLAFGLVWFALVAPADLSRLTPASFLRIPVEALVFMALLLVLPRTVGRILAATAGIVLGLLIIVKILDTGFVAALDRPFDPVSDWSYVGPAIGVLSDSIGRAGAIVATVVAAAVVTAVVISVPLSVRRLSLLTTRRRGGSSRFVAAFAVIWMFSALIGLQIAGGPFASADAAGLVYDRVNEIRSSIKDQQSFAATMTHDPIGITAAGNLLTGLRGKDVIFAFVESYGRVAVQDSAFSPGVDAVLDAGTGRLRAAGFAAESAFLTSPTFGGISWLAHSTLQSGLWVDSQLRYDELVAGGRFTLTGAFKRAGWRTVGDVPSNYKDWPEGSSFYHYDQLYDNRNVGYHGPAFSYADMPDQYILSAYQRLELAAPQHPPVMAEIDLVSSHTPWAPLPRTVDWNQVGDGSVFAGMPAQGKSPNVVWRHVDQVGAEYGQSIEYSIDSLVSFVENYGRDNLVLVLLGDHQPAAIVAGQHAGHDVPITIIAHDPAVLAQISGWGWTPGMRPAPQAPVWPMDAFRNRFLHAFGS